MDLIVCPAEQLQCQSRMLCTDLLVLAGTAFGMSAFRMAVPGPSFELAKALTAETEVRHGCASRRVSEATGRLLLSCGM